MNEKFKDIRITHYVMEHPFKLANSAVRRAFELIE
jgi:hypothetical protein